MLQWDVTSLEQFGGEDKLHQIVFAGSTTVIF